MAGQDLTLVTGAMGCLGAWTLYHLVQEGAQVLAFDQSSARQRLNLLLSPAEQQRIHFVEGDLRDFAQVQRCFQDYPVRHVIHLAALQVPFCRANPVLGAEVNVVGTVNLFEAARQQGLSHLAYASSIAVYGPPELYAPGLLPHDAPFFPQTLYGVYKQANEGTARLYWQDYGLSSVALRPYTVYGLGRDQGLTSEPTLAMLAAAAGQPFRISFGGRMQFQFASDVARAFIAASRQPLPGAQGFNLGGPAIKVAQLAAMISEQTGVTIEAGTRRLFFPPGFEDSALRHYLPDLPSTPLEAGIQQSIAQFRRCLADGRLQYPPSTS